MKFDKDKINLIKAYFEIYFNFFKDQFDLYYLNDIDLKESFNDNFKIKAQ